MSSTLGAWRVLAVICCACLGIWGFCGVKIIWGWSTFALVLLIVGSEQDRLDMGFSFGNRLSTITSIGAILFIATGTIICAAQAPCTLENIVLKRLGYIAGSFLQEFLLQSFIFVRFEAYAGRSNALFASALIFGTLHLWNPVLTPVTFILGYALSWLFQRNRSLIEVAVIHAIIGVTGLLVLPGKFMKVGIGYQLHQ